MDFSDKKNICSLILDSFTLEVHEKGLKLIDNYNYFNFFKKLSV